MSLTKVTVLLKLRGLLTARPRRSTLVIDSALARVNAGAPMDLDDLFSGKPADPLTEVGRQDLGPLSIEELEARIAALREEIARVETHMAETARHKASADALFAKR